MEIDSSSSINSSSTVFSENEPKYSPKIDFKPAERVNPFDKNIVGQTAVKKADTSFDHTPLYKPTTSVAITAPTTATSKVFSSTSSELGDKFDATPLSYKSNDFKRGIRSNSIAAHSDYSASTYASVTMKDKTFPITDSTSSGKPKLKRLGSLSDAELIFGNTTDTSKVNAYIVSNPISSASDLTTSSYSTSSDSFTGAATDTSYKIYDGIQNHAFQDIESPIMTTNTDDYDLK